MAESLITYHVLRTKDARTARNYGLSHLLANGAAETKPEDGADLSVLLSMVTDLPLKEKQSLLKTLIQQIQAELGKQEKQQEESTALMRSAGASARNRSLRAKG